MTIEIAGPLPEKFRFSFRVPAHRPDPEMLEAELGDALDTARTQGGGRAQLWVPRADDAADRLAARHGFTAYRDLLQLRAPLPAPGGRTDLTVRAFDPQRDLDEFIAVNARSFAWHPEQGRLTTGDVRRSMSEPWFDAKGFLLHHIEGRLAGFCWTKVHDEEDPPLGEIYVIAIDPDFHGRGLGRHMTRAGLDHLADQGLTTAMLYVESDNLAANRVYEQLGFRHHQTDRAYQGVLR